MPNSGQKIHIVVIGHPDLQRGLGWLPCLMCEQPYPVQVSAARAARQISKIVLCFSCVTTKTKFKALGVGVNRLRERLGLEPL